MYKACLILILLFPLSAPAQVKDSLQLTRDPYRRKNIESSFDEQMNSFRFRNGLNYYAISGDLFAGVNQNYYSTVVTSPEKTTKEEEYLNFLCELRGKSFFTTGFLFSTRFYSDDRKLAINSASESSLRLYSKILEGQEYNLSLSGGYASARQMNKTDPGYLYGLQGNTSGLRFGDVALDSKLFIENWNLSPRKNSIKDLNIALKNEIEDGIQNIMQAAYSSRRKDLYFEKDSVTTNIEARTETVESLSDKISAKEIAKGLSGSLTGTVSKRDIDRNTKYSKTQTPSSSVFDADIKEVKLGVESQLEYGSEDFSSLFRTSFLEKDEKHSVKDIPEINRIFYTERLTEELGKNNRSLQFQASFSGSYNINGRNRIQLSLMSRKLAYDTESELNFDDRDELLDILRLVYTRDFNSYFSMHGLLEGTMNHIVYIYSERSANNNKKRILRLELGGTIKTERIYSDNSASVSSDYTVYDFEDTSPNLRSYSFRQYSVNDSSYFRLSNNSLFSLKGRLKISEQGQLFWNSFSTAPERFSFEASAIPRFELRLGILGFAIGIQYYLLNSYSYNSDGRKFLETSYCTVGPVSEFSYGSEALSLKISSGYDFTRVTGLKSPNQLTLNLALSWTP